MRNNKLKHLNTFGQAQKIARAECEKQYESIFAECAADAMHQTLANVLLCLEKDFGFGEIRLKRVVSSVKMWADAMNESTDITAAWTARDNIEYFKKKYGIDLKAELQCEVKNVK